MNRLLSTLTVMLLTLPVSNVLAQEGKTVTEDTPAPSAVLQLDQTVISGNQELPKVLYILPWREPNGLPDVDIEGQFSEAEVFKRLYPPAYRRELSYFETLQGLSETERPDQDQE